MTLADRETLRSIVRAAIETHTAYFGRPSLDPVRIGKIADQIADALAAQPASPPSVTEAQLDAMVEAWFRQAVEVADDPQAHFRKRMLAALTASRPDAPEDVNG